MQAETAVVKLEENSGIPRVVVHPVVGIRSKPLLVQHPKYFSVYSWFVLRSSSTSSRFNINAFCIFKEPSYTIVQSLVRKVFTLYNCVVPEFSVEANELKFQKSLWFECQV